MREVAASTPAGRAAAAAGAPVPAPTGADAAGEKVVVTAIAPGAGLDANDAAYDALKADWDFRVAGKAGADYDVYPATWPKGRGRPNLQSFAEGLAEAGDVARSACLVFGSRGGQVVLPWLWREFGCALPPAVVINGGCAQSQVPDQGWQHWPDDAITVMLMGGQDYFKGKLTADQYMQEAMASVPTANSTTAIIYVNQMSHSPSRSLLLPLLRLLVRAAMEWKAGCTPSHVFALALEVLRVGGWSGRFACKRGAGSSAVFLAAPELPGDTWEETSFGTGGGRHSVTKVPARRRTMADPAAGRLVPPPSAELPPFVERLPPADTKPLEAKPSSPATWRWSPPPVSRAPPPSASAVPARAATSRSLPVAAAPGRPASPVMARAASGTCAMALASSMRSCGSTMAGTSTTRSAVSPVSTWRSGGSPSRGVLRSAVIAMSPATSGRVSPVASRGGASPVRAGRGEVPPAGTATAPGDIDARQPPGSATIPTAPAPSSAAFEEDPTAPKRPGDPRLSAVPTAARAAQARGGAAGASVAMAAKARGGAVVASLAASSARVPMTRRSPVATERAQMAVGAQSPAVQRLNIARAQLERKPLDKLLLAELQKFNAGFFPSQRALGVTASFSAR